MAIVHLRLYSKPGCHLCEGLAAKIQQIADLNLGLAITLEIRDITSQPDWWQAYEYEIPVLYQVIPTAENHETDRPLPRPAPRLSTVQLAQWLQKHCL